MNERQIQYRLYRALWQQSELMVPNCCVFGWEADMLRVTKAGYVWEYEIKISRADYLADTDKTRKHEILSTGGTEEWTGELLVRDRPRHFIYLMPAGIAQAAEMPDYAGFVQLEPQNNGVWRLAVIKPPPALGKGKITDEQRLQMLLSTYHRFWQYRRRG